MECVTHPVDDVRVCGQVVVTDEGSQVLLADEALAVCVDGQEHVVLAVTRRDRELLQLTFDLVDE